MRTVKLSEISCADTSNIKIRIFGNHFCFTPFGEDKLLKGDNCNYFENDKGLYWHSPVYCIDEIDDFIDLLSNSYSASTASNFNKLNKSDLKINLLEIFNMNRQICVNEENLEVSFSDMENEMLYLIANTTQNKNVLDYLILRPDNDVGRGIILRDDITEEIAMKVTHNTNADIFAKHHHISIFNINFADKRYYWYIKGLFTHPDSYVRFLYARILRVFEVPYSLIRILFFDKEFDVRERVLSNMTADNAVFFTQYELEGFYFEILNNKSSHFNQGDEPPYYRLLNRPNAQFLFLPRLKCLAYRYNIHYEKTEF